jgi:16S rRNA (cytosine967-C5)-methyltransferase
MTGKKAHPIEIAAKCTQKIFEEIESGFYSLKSSLVIDREIEKAKLNGAFASRTFDVTMGVLRWRNRLDMEIARHLTKSKLDLPGFEINLLRAAAYELVIRKCDEPAGLINEIVEITKSHSNSGFTSFTNAILRKLASSEPLPKPNGNAPVNDLANYYSLDDYTIEKMIAQNGMDWTLSVLNATGDRIVHQMRVNPFVEFNEAYPEQLGAVAQSYRGEVIWESQALTPEIRKASIDGRIIIQSLPSQTASIVLDPRPGDKVLDAASGAGIKAHHLVSLMAGWGELTLTDLSPAKRDICYDNFERWDVPEPDYLIMDLTDASDIKKEIEGEEFDSILLDVPCSGSGLIHHLPEKRYTLGKTDISRFQAVQKQMLINCLNLLVSEGSLVYSTCSIWQEENEQVTQSVLAEINGFESVERLHYQPCGNHIGFYIEKIRRLE